jgi:3-deoxy-7-phosphoheptulonate synthase
MDPRDIEIVIRYSDVVQIGTRNMQNFSLLLEVGMCDKPILLKRGLSATIKEWLMAAEYIMSRGNQKVILCERGIRTFETATRNTLDLSAVPLLKQLTHLPVVVDPSHGVGKWDLVAPMSKAAVAAGADGLVIEVHTNPEEALSDGEQSIKPSAFKKLMDELKPIAIAVGRKI